MNGKGQLSWMSKKEIKAYGTCGPFQCIYKGILNADGFSDGKCVISNLKGLEVKVLEGLINTPFSGASKSAASTPQKSVDEETKEQTPVKGSDTKSKSSPTGSDTKSKSSPASSLKESQEKQTA